jgi:hypothetical protein
MLDSALGPALVLNIGEFLDLCNLNSLVRTSRGYALLLTPLLYHRAFRYQPTSTDKSIDEREGEEGEEGEEEYDDEEPN